MTTSVSIDLFKGHLFSPKQAAIVGEYRLAKIARKHGDPHPHIFVLVWGRRCGKSDGASKLFAEMLADLMDEIADAIANQKPWGATGTVPRPWAGIGKKRMLQRKTKPHARCLITAPRSADLTEISGFLLNIFRDEAEVYLHPDQSMRVDANGARMWFLKDGACVSVELIPSVSKSAMVGRGWSIVLLSEAGFIGSEQWDRLSPALWDQSPWVIAEGTPEQDPSHWLTQLAVSGLEDGDPEADRTIADRNPSVYTSRANTIDHAFLRSARERAALEEQYRGKRWGDKWIRASWSAPSDVVFDAWREDRGVVKLHQYPLEIVHPEYGSIALTPPSKRECYVDWHGGSAPGAAIVVYVWMRGNPLSKDDPRPLFLVVDEHMDDEKRLQYDADGWWHVIRTMRDKWSCEKIFGDPSGETLMRQAKRFGLRIKPAVNDEKIARLEIVNSLCNVPETIEGARPALLVANTCPKTIVAMNTYHWKVDARTQLPTDKPSQYNDHLTDCLAYAAGHHAKRSVAPVM